MRRRCCAMHLAWQLVCSGSLSRARCSRPPTRHGLHSTAGTLRPVRGALVALFALCGWAGLCLAPRGSFRVIHTVVLCRSRVTRRLRDLLPPDLLGAAAAYAFCSARIFTGVSRAKVVPRATGGLCVGAVAPCISPGCWFALEISRALQPTTSRRDLHSTAGTLRAVSGALVSPLFLCG